MNDCARSVASFANLKAKHVGVFTDPTVAKLPVMKVVRSPFAKLGPERGREMYLRLTQTCLPFCVHAFAGRKVARGQRRALYHL